MEKKFKEFKPTSWSIDNKTSIFVLAIIIALFGKCSRAVHEVWYEKRNDG